MIHAKGVLAFVATTLLLCAPGEARTGGRELLQSEKGRQGKDKGGNIIPETQPDGASSTDVKTASCTACSGTCESCNNLDIEAGITIDNCRDVDGELTCDVSVSNALMPWKAGGGISWGRITSGACDAAAPWDTDSVKEEEITGPVKVNSVVFPKAPCSSAELCIAVHDGSLDPCKDENYPERTECPVQTIRDGGVKTSNQLCKICQQTITVNKPKEASCEDPFGCTGPDQCFGAGCGLVGIDGKLGPCECNKLNGKFQNTNDPYCQNENNGFGDEYTCSEELCDPANSNDASGCKRTPDLDNARCNDEIACTKDLCGAAALPLVDGESYGKVNDLTGCINRKQDSVCKDAANNFADNLACTSEICTARSAENGGCESVADAQADEFCDDTLGCTTNTCELSKPASAGDYDTRGCFTTYSNAYCENQDNYADAYSCTVETCSPKASGADVGAGKTGCLTTVEENVCSDDFKCTADKCYVDVASPPTACSGTSVLDCIEQSTGCVYKTQDAVCTPLSKAIGCGTFKCGVDSEGSVAVGGYADGAYTGCFGVPETGSCGTQPDCGSLVCDLSFPTPGGCDIVVVPNDDADCKEDPDNFCTADTCIATGEKKGTCKNEEIDNNERACVSCTSPADCTAAAEPCETGVCFGSTADYPNTCNFELKEDCETCPNGVSSCSAKPCKTPSCSNAGECDYTEKADCVVCPTPAEDDGGCPPKPCQTVTCNSGECSYSTDTAADDTACTIGDDSGCCSSGACNLGAVTPCGGGGGGGGGPASPGICTGEGYSSTGCDNGQCCRDGACETCAECYEESDCANSAKGGCCEYNKCVECPANCASDGDCAAYPGTCCIKTDVGSGGQGICLSEGCPKPNPCPNTDDMDGDELYDCVDPCNGPKQGRNTCPGPQASHPSYFTVSSCTSATATVTYNRAPQLKTTECDANDSISWVTIYWLQNGKASGTMCTKVDEIPADGEVKLANVPCGETVYVLAHDGQYPAVNTDWQRLYDKSSAGLILDGGCTSQDVGSKCPVGSVTINCATCKAE